MKRFIMKILVVVLILSLMAGCGSADAPSSVENTPIASSSTPSSNEIAPTASAAETAESGKASDVPLTLTVHYHNNNYKYHDELPVFKAIAEKTNITFKNTVPPTATDGNEAYNMMIVSGEYPDLVRGTKDNILRDAREGVFIPLNELIDKHAPNIKKLFEERPDVKNAVKDENGDIYMLPFIGDLTVGEGWVIRNDWLKRLGLEVPETMDEMVNVLREFKNKDANGNGDPNDEIPLFFRKSGFAYEFTYTSFGFWGMSHEFGIKDDGRVYFGYYEPEAKEVFEWCNMLYKEGLVDEEVYTRVGDPRIAFIMQNDIGGMTHDWLTGLSTCVIKGKERNPELDMIGIAPPKGKDGIAREVCAVDSIRTITSMAITSANKHPVETIKYLDYLFSDEGRMYMNFGIEGVTYDMVNGEPVIKPEMINNPDGLPVAKYMPKEYGTGLEWSYRQDYRFPLQTYDDFSKDLIDLYKKNNYIMPSFPKMLMSYTKEENEAIALYKTTIDTTCDEWRMKFIIGETEINDSNMEAFRKDLKVKGIEQYIAAYQTAYNRFLGKNNK